MWNILLDREAATIWRAWLIPTKELERVAKRRTGNLVITPSPSTASADRYTPWRCLGVREVAKKIAGGFGWWGGRARGAAPEWKTMARILTMAELEARPEAELRKRPEPALVALVKFLARRAAERDCAASRKDLRTIRRKSRPSGAAFPRSL